VFEQVTHLVQGQPDRLPLGRAYLVSDSTSIAQHVRENMHLELTPQHGRGLHDFLDLVFQPIQARYKDSAHVSRQRRFASFSYQTPFAVFLRNSALFAQIEQDLFGKERVTFGPFDQ
jgi:hypothetical protein